MEKFTTLTGVAAPLPMINVDTDMIIPKQHLKTIKRTGLGGALFEEMRFTPDGAEVPGFVLNQPAWRNASILVVGANFGCGSSREHAVWAIRDLGFQCIIAKSFGDTFYFNCLTNGLLAITLGEDEVDRLVSSAGEGKILVDLENQRVQGPDGEVYPFEMDEFRRDCLLKGLDAIDLTLQDEDLIAAFEAQQRVEQPWLFASPSQTTDSRQ
ncbi:3-isopropylmalate dehydratase small subunit [candidate division KSB1 bacterium]|nr:3-isopropylmalate dehydratase small subunit [candidate division KSB1 bacterium]